MAADDHAPGGAGAESSRERELARNESFFRNVNEIAEENAWASDLVDFVCECSRGGCMQRISLTAREYEHIRAEGDHFVLVPGHEDRSIERVIETHAGYLVVEKFGEAGAVALRDDPR